MADDEVVSVGVVNDVVAGNEGRDDELVDDD